MKRTWSSEVQKLAELETFDAAAFITDAKDKSQQDCGYFVLALALVFNDIKGLLAAISLLVEEVPRDRATPSRELGAFAGVYFQVIRTLFGALRELLDLVKREEATHKRPSFQTVVRQMPSNQRKAWAKLVAASEANKSSDPDVNFLIRARNAVAYHYETAAIGQGFCRAFKDASDEPFLSRGSTIASTRFYFADRAAQSFLQLQLGDEDIESYFSRDPKLIHDIAFALFSVVTGFITSRRCAWRKPAN
jgi:hypothetical protein